MTQPDTSVRNQIATFAKSVAKPIIILTIVALVIWLMIVMDRKSEEAHRRIMQKFDADLESCRSTWMDGCLKDNPRYKCDVMWAEANLQCH
jgi:hypothetical protein